MIKAIPYFGKNNNDVSKYIIEKEPESDIIETDIYSFINNNINPDNTLVVIIDNKYFTYLDDIQFNYRDHKIVLPYWKYELHKVTEQDDITIKRDIFQYIIKDESENFYIRHNYNYQELMIQPGVILTLFDLKVDKKFKVKFTALTTLKSFDIDKLYKLYIESAYTDYENILSERIKGYYFIDKVTKRLYNRELKLRRELELETFSQDYSPNQLKDYRDVRNYKQEEIVIKYGLVESLENYRERRLRFESLLYCVMNDNLLSNDEQFNKELVKLGKTKDIIKYGNNIKLIFKSYWLKEYKPIKYKTWLKVNKANINIKQTHK